MRDRVFSNFLEEKKLITTLVNSATSFSDVLRRAGFAKRNTRRAAAIKRVSKELGLDISHFYPQFSSDQKLADVHRHLPIRIIRDEWRRA